MPARDSGRRGTSICVSAALLLAAVLGPIDMVTMNARADWTAEAEFSPELVYCGQMFYFAINYTNTGDTVVTLHYARGEVDWGGGVEKTYTLMGLERTLGPGDAYVLDPAVISPVPDVPNGTYTIVVTVGGSNPGDIFITKKIFSCDFTVAQGPPIRNVSIQASALSGEAPLTVDLSMTAEGVLADSLLYGWTFGDGNYTHSWTDRSARHTFTEPGTYQVIAWVTDKTNRAANATINITVDPKAEPPAPPEEPGDDAGTAPAEAPDSAAGGHSPEDQGAAGGGADFLVSILLPMIGIAAILIVTMTRTRPPKGPSG